MWWTTCRRAWPEVCTQASEVGLTRLAVVLDVRRVLRASAGHVQHLSMTGALPEILYLEASDDVIVRRQEVRTAAAPAAG